MSTLDILTKLHLPDHQWFDYWDQVFASSKPPPVFDGESGYYGTWKNKMGAEVKSHAINGLAIKIDGEQQ